MIDPKATLQAKPKQDILEKLRLAKILVNKIMAVYTLKQK
jgi:hypothetical protein